MTDVDEDDDDDGETGDGDGRGGTSGGGGKQYREYRGGGDDDDDDDDDDEDNDDDDDYDDDYDYDDDDDDDDGPTVVDARDLSSFAIGSYEPPNRVSPLCDAMVGVTAMITGADLDEGEDGRAVSSSKLLLDLCRRSYVVLYEEIMRAKSEEGVEEDAWMCCARVLAEEDEEEEEDLGDGMDWGRRRELLLDVRRFLLDSEEAPCGPDRN